MAEKSIYLASRSPRRRELLKQIGIDYAQGYLAHVPEPLDALLSELSAAAQP